MINDIKVAIRDDKEIFYPSKAPYHPSKTYPESPIDLLGVEENKVYDNIRQLLCDLQLDIENYGKSNWNPLGTVIKPGETVVIKPNLVRNFHDEYTGDWMDVLITHGSVIRAMVDYAYIALQGKGRIIISDAPQNDAVFEKIVEHCGFESLKQLYQSEKDFLLEFYDLRQEYVQKEDGVLLERKVLKGDPLGYVAVDLKQDSEFHQVGELCKKLRGAEYDMGETYQHHNAERNEYLVCKTILSADVIINLPKLKTHKKAGVTLCQKNLIGINGNKNWLPHHREGTPSDGGDQYQNSNLKQKLERILISAFKRVFPFIPFGRKFVARFTKQIGNKAFGETNKGVVRSGNWYGNDTIWRTILDLNKIIFYADQNGGLHQEPQRKFFCLIDGIISGEGNGPLAPEKREDGLLIAGFNPVTVDLATCYLMGFDFMKISQYKNALEIGSYPLIDREIAVDEIAGTYNSNKVQLKDIQNYAKDFEPHFGWANHIELDRK